MTAFGDAYYNPKEADFLTDVSDLMCQHLGITRANIASYASAAILSRGFVGYNFLPEEPPIIDKACKDTLTLTKLWPYEKWMENTPETKMTAFESFEKFLQEFSDYPIHLRRHICYLILTILAHVLELRPLWDLNLGG